MEFRKLAGRQGQSVKQLPLLPFSSQALTTTCYALTISALLVRLSISSRVAIGVSLESSGVARVLAVERMLRASRNLISIVRGQR